MGIATLQGIQFRIDPNSISYDYSVDYSIIDTLGGRVIQVLGSTISDITITGDFGQQHQQDILSWQLAESFSAQIRGLMDQQVVPPKNTANGSVHAPLRFTYLDGVHNWDMKVLIKSYEDASGNGSIEHRTEKFAYGYKLTLFMVQDNSLTLSRVQADKFIARISKGLGWKDTRYSVGGSFSGSDTLADAIQFIQSQSSDGSFDGYLSAVVQGQLPNAPGATGSSGGTGTTVGTQQGNAQ